MARTERESLGVARDLREYATALDKDRGHDKSCVTAVMRIAADRIEYLESKLAEYTNDAASSAGRSYGLALARIVDSDDRKREAWASGQHSSIGRWIPTEEAIQAARELLGRA